MFITIDGGDGVGKSTQIARLSDFLSDAGHPTLVCRDPGTTRLGEAVRGLLLGAHETDISAVSELFLFMAARSQMVRELIRPALEEGNVVIADRFLLSTLVYQGYAGGLSTDDIWTVGQIATEGLYPDLTIILDLDPEQAMKRIDRPFDRMELKGAEYHRAVREGFLRGARELTEKYHREVLLLDASESPNAVADRIADRVTVLMKK